VNFGTSYDRVEPFLQKKGKMKSVKPVIV